MVLRDGNHSRLRSTVASHIRELVPAMNNQPLIPNLAAQDPRQTRPPHQAPTMPTGKHTSPFPSLDLTIADKQHLLQTADALLSQVEREFEDFLWQDKAKIDLADWDLVKEREDIRVYHDRHHRADVGGKKVHLILTTGTIRSTLNDTMFGELNPTTEDMRIKTALVQDTFVDAAVLATILEPTVDDPFQSTTVRWFVMDIPLLARAIAKQRDFVFLESTGVRQLSNGERVGFRLKRSVTLAKAPPLPAFDRMNASSCALWREVGPNTVQLFMTTYVEIEDSIVMPLLVKSSANALIAVGRVTNSTRTKKLAWLQEQKATFLQLADAGHPGMARDRCSVCVSQGRSTRQSIKSPCAICSRSTCTACRVKSEMCLSSLDGQLIKYEMRVCLYCLAVANNLDAETIARDQARGKSEQVSDYQPVRTATIDQAMRAVTPHSKLGADSTEDPAAYATWISSTSPVSLQAKYAARTSSSSSSDDATASLGSTLSAVRHTLNGRRR